ncbi:putative immunoglobulin-blocking virulence protein [Mesomycoplasma ovipneumoniae]|uniref:putative immunoglobulin-blocking virulence protein n=1 Tax=Mesomycoplasma ovipneumoniae TaxID=29562 RepID=UPI0028B0AE30|nr:putative immunoglobulin-blocking virulence protein [Mesomycoplasma ovipneumoniae]WNM13167.1 putative immunoglobulin-blocking virulence protein [Mesomycoplasma ovipneumoniae]
MQIFYVSKRKKYLIGAAASAVAVSFSFALNEVINNFNWEPPLVAYSPQAPSIILKNIPNDTAFNSPVTNSEYIPVKKPEPKKIESPTPVTQPQKVEKIPPKVEIPKQVKKIAIATPKPQPTPTITRRTVTRIESTIPIPAPSVSRTASSPVQSTATTTQRVQTSPRQSQSVNVPAGAIEQAKANWRLGLAASKRRTEANIASRQAEIAELERQLKHEFKRYYPNGGEHEKKLFEESLKYQIWVANNYKTREDNYLKFLKQQEIEGPQFSDVEYKFIARGMTVDVNDHHGWVFVNPDDNPVTGKNGLYRQRNQNRLLSNEGWVQRNPQGIANQNYEGWDKADISSNSEWKKEIDKVTGSGSGSIKVYQYTQNAQNKHKAFKPQIIAVSIDANDKNAFEKFQEFLKSNVGNKIDAVVLKNVGTTNKDQNIDKILAALPNNVQKLTLFLDDQKAINGLHALRGKKLKELELYSNQKAIDDNWAINPNAVANVDFISFDYNNAADFHKNTPDEQIPGSILFDTLRWDKGDDAAKITEGLKLAFGSKIYQRPFQGRHGGKGGYPPKLDFSETGIKTIKNLKFDEIDKIFNENIKNWKEDKYANQDYEGFKKLRFTDIYFGADSNSGSNTTSAPSFSANVSDFDGSKYTDKLSGISERYDSPSGRIYFRNETGQNQQNVTFNISGTPTEDAKEQLKAFVEAVNNAYPFSKIVVDSEEIKQELIKFYQEKTKDPKQKQASIGKFALREISVKSSSASSS